ncbi:MAG: CARDB domain-containing protein [Pyrinomonadaceae bacterium]
MKKISVITFAFLLAGNLFADKILAQTRPDLVVSQVAIKKDAQNLFVDKITVTVLNACRQSNAGESYVLVTFKQSNAKDAKAIYYIGNTVKALKGGETFVQTFDVSEKKIGVGRYIYVEADPYRKVTEASEDNNWRTLNPNDAGTFLSQGQCSPKI